MLTRRSGEAVGSDRVDLSERARMASELRDRLASLPEVREARVAALRRAVAAGEYRPQADVVAERMLQSGAFTDLL